MKRSKKKKTKKLKDWEEKEEEEVILGFLKKTKWNAREMGFYLVDILIEMRMDEGLGEQNAGFGPTHSRFLLRN